MRLTIVTVGSRGDVQPYVALGLGLQRAGYDVHIATNPEFEPFVCDHGLTFVPVRGNTGRAVLGRVGQQMLDPGRASLVFLRMLMSQSQQRRAERNSPLHQHVVDCLNACQGSDAILCSLPAFFASHAVAEKLRVPFFPAYVYPIHTTRAFPVPNFPSWLRLGDSYNLATWAISRQFVWQLFRRATNQARQEVLGLPPLPFAGPYYQMYRRHQPFLYGFSTAVVPRPPDWGPWLHVTGYWFLDHAARWQPPAVLADFLAAGPPPVYVGFGSVWMKNQGMVDELTEVVLAALKRAKQRGVLLTGPGGLASHALPDDVFAIESAPFDWLFPRMAALVHHGGSGTSSAAFRAGVPSIIIPFLGDQLFWARRVAELHVGPGAIRRKHLSVDRLAAAIDRAVHDQNMRNRAAALGRAVDAEDGVAHAVAVLDRYMRARG